MFRTYFLALPWLFFDGAGREGLVKEGGAWLALILIQAALSNNNLVRVPQCVGKFHERTSISKLEKESGTIQHPTQSELEAGSALCTKPS